MMTRVLQERRYKQAIDSVCNCSDNDRTALLYTTADISLQARSSWFKPFR